MAEERTSRMSEERTSRSGWITFAGVTVMIVGAYNALSGIAALTDDDTVAAQVNEVLYGIDLTAWGWFWLIVGLLQLVTGVLILGRNMCGTLARCGRRVAERNDDRVRHLHIPHLGDRGPRAGLPGALRAADPQRRVPGVTLSTASGAPCRTPRRG